MKAWRRIGCAVDFSEASRAGLESAATLAARPGAELFVIHVSEERAAPGPAPLLAPPPVSARAEKHGPELEAWALEAERLGAAAVRSVLVRGRAAAAIVRLAEEERLDLLVVASHGHGGLRRLVLGSVAEEVVRAAPCPVLVVRAPRA